MNQFENLFDYAEAKKTNTLLSGANASGKTRLSCALASMLHKMGNTVIVVDISGAWKKISDLPLWTKPYKFNDSVEIADFEPFQSRIYDLSTLKLNETRITVDAIAAKIWENRIEHPCPNMTFLFLEESEGFLRNIRGKLSQEIYRIVHIGRNVGVRCALITTDLALLDASVIRLCGIRFHGGLTVEENSKRKFRAYYGKDWARIATEALETGDFIRYLQYNKKRPLQVVSVPEYKANPKAKLYLKFKKPQQNPEITPNYEPSIINHYLKKSLGLH